MFITQPTSTLHSEWSRYTRPSIRLEGYTVKYSLEGFSWSLGEHFNSTKWEIKWVKYKCQYKLYTGRIFQRGIGQKCRENNI